jgi:3-methylcrotonyl-CoA carboxylase beta subunit
MKQIKSNIDASHNHFRDQVQSYSPLLSIYYSSIRSITNREKNSAVLRHRLGTRLDVKQRIEWLIDEKKSFPKLSLLAAHGLYNKELPSAGIITYISKIHGTLSMIIAIGTNAKGGAYREKVKKHLQGQQISMRNHLPCVFLDETGGIFLPEQSQIFPGHDGLGRIFYNQSPIVTTSLPQGSISKEFFKAEGASVPSMKDKTIIVRNQVTIFTCEPPLIKAATSEEVTTKELGSTFVHMRISEVPDHLAENVIDTFQICRKIFERIPQYETQPIEGITAEESAYDSFELVGLALNDFIKQADIYEFIARIVDIWKLEEFKRRMISIK